MFSADLAPYFEFHRAVLPKPLSQELKQHVEDWFPVKRSICKVWNVEHTVPRDQVVIPETTEYKYAKHSIQSVPWEPSVIQLRDWLIQTYGLARLDYCIINGYHTPDSVGLHADLEPFLDQTQPIVSVSLGASRYFKIAYADTNKQACKILLQDRDVLIMKPGAQSRFKHAVPAPGHSQIKLHGRRYNFTFRCRLAVDQHTEKK